jgi:hypothetical protein
LLRRSHVTTLALWIMASIHDATPDLIARTLLGTQFLVKFDLSLHLLL